MARNGSGTYSLPAGNPVVTGTTISSTWANNTLSDIATALTGSIAADGQTTASGNLPMGGNVHTGVGNATLRTMYASAAQVEDGSLNYLTSVSGVDTITATAPVGMTAYAAGQVFRFISAGANTGAATLNLNAIGAKAITKRGTTALEANDIPSGAAVEVIYDGTQFQLIDPASASTPVTTISFGSTGLTPSTATTGAVTVAGTLAASNGGTGLTSAGTSGNILTSDGTNWTSAAPPSTGFTNVQVFTSSGTFTVPTGVTKVKVTVVGGGGNGSDASYNGSGNPTGVGIGGGGGGAAIKVISGLTPGGTVSVTVGAAAGTSSFGAYCSATGGASANGTPYVNSNSYVSGGIGSGGDLNIKGSSGVRLTQDSPVIAGSGGSSIFGGGGTGAFATSTGNISGAAGGAYGGGGGGAACNIGSSGGPGSSTGGAGASGVVIVEY